jgi:hypothetical protein
VTPLVMSPRDDNVEHLADATICACGGWALAVLATRAGVLQWEVICSRWIAGPHGFADRLDPVAGRRW